MAIAKVTLNDLINYKEGIGQLIEVLNSTQGEIGQLEKAERSIQKEIGEYENISKKCGHILSELNNKLKQLKEKKRWAQQEIQKLKNEIQAIKTEITALEQERAALSAESAFTSPPQKAFVSSRLNSVKAELSEQKARKAELENQLEQVRKELERTNRNIETATRLVSEAEQKKLQTEEGIRELNSAEENLQKTVRLLYDLLQQFTCDSRRAVESLNRSREYINHYIEIRLDGVQYDLPKTVKIRRCLNLEYAGKIYDYNASRNDNEQLLSQEQVRYLQEKYPDIKYSPIDGFGNTYPDFSRYEIFSCKFPTVTKENLAKGVCLIGDSKSGSADFKKFRQVMEEAGYSKQEIASLLLTHTIHHDEDGQTLRLMPRDLHKACRHNGGAEKIRLQIAML